MPVCPVCHRQVEDGAVACPACGSATTLDEAAGKRIGATIAGRYFVHQLLGRGGMADVFKATDLTQDRPVALKILRRSSLPDDEGQRRFRRELAAASRLRHPNSVEVFDFGIAADGSAYLSMEFVPGRTLAQVIAGGVPLAEERALHIASQILSALAEAHRLGIIHRDLKPANVMLDPLRGGGDHAMVLDFGIATLGEQPADEARLTQRGMVFGTPAYMSPEQIRGEPLDTRSDLYSVGVLLFEMLTGTLPFEAPIPVGLAVKHLTEPPPRLAERRPAIAVAPAVEALLMQALQKDRELRPASASVMRSQLLQHRFEGGGEAPTPPPVVLPPTQSFPALEGGDESQGGASAALQNGARSAPLGLRPSHRAARAALLAGAGLVALAAVWVLVGRGTTRPPEATVSPSSVAPERAAAAEVPPEPTPPLIAATNPVPSPPVADTTSAAHPARIRKVSPASAPPSGPAPAAESAPPSSIRLVRGELNSIATPPALTGDGVLVLEATPWAEVSIDGMHLGETPREVRLAAGRHTLRAIHPELGTREEQVVLRAGERQLWSVTFEP